MRSDGDGKDHPHEQAHTEALGSVGYLLFDSLVHHLIEKGVLTKNDALSVVQTVAEVVRSRMDDGETRSQQTSAALATLDRTYSSFEAMQDRTGAAQLDGHNVHPLRPPLHGDRPRFPSDD
jgi:hypothetical protein